MSPASSSSEESKAKRARYRVYKNTPRLKHTTTSFLRGQASSTPPVIVDLSSVDHNGSGVRASKNGCPKDYVIPFAVMEVLTFSMDHMYAQWVIPLHGGSSVLVPDYDPEYQWDYLHPVTYRTIAWANHVNAPLENFEAVSAAWMPCARSIWL